MNRRHPVARLAPAAPIAALVATLSLAACGGGGNESGPPDSILLSPTSVTATGPVGACARGVGPTVFVFGGTPPYTLTNSYPLGMTLDVKTVKNSGEGFTITLNGVCMDTIPINVQDDMGRIATMTVTNARGT